MQILVLALLLAGLVPTLQAQSPSRAAQAPATAAGPRVRTDWRSYQPELQRDRLTSDAALPKKQTVTVETWVIIVAAVVLIILLV